MKEKQNKRKFYLNNNFYQEVCYNFLIFFIFYDIIIIENKERRLLQLSKKADVKISDFYCTKCGNRSMSLPRRNGRFREPGHLKSLWCYHCKEEVNHAEVRPFGSYSYEDFCEEFILGRFVDGQRVPIAQLTGCGHISCRYNKNGKCWNANNSFCCDLKKKRGIINE